MKTHRQASSGHRQSANARAFLILCSSAKPAKSLPSASVQSSCQGVKLNFGRFTPELGVTM